MDKQLFRVFLLGCLVAITGCDKGDKTAPAEKAPVAVTETEVVPEEKPAVMEEMLLTTEATVTAIDHETRLVTLQTTDGESVTFIAGEQIRNLAQVEEGDVVTVDYLEAIEIQVLDPDAELGAGEITAAARAEPGEKPAGAAISETTIVVVIESIDEENETVTLTGPEGNSKTVKVRNPDNLEKITVGDKVMITYTEAFAVNVTGKSQPAGN